MNGQKSSKFIIGVAVVVVIVTGAVAFVVWQLIDSVESNSKKVHQYISKSKDYDGNVTRDINEKLQSNPFVGEKVESETQDSKLPQCARTFLVGEGEAKLGNTKGALASFSTAIEQLKSEPPTIVIHLRGMRFSHDQFLGALYDAKASCYMNLHRKKDAIVEMDKAIAIDPNNGEHLFARSRMDKQFGIKAETATDMKSIRDKIQQLNIMPP